MEAIYPEFAVTAEGESHSDGLETSPEGESLEDPIGDYCPGIETDVYWYHPNYLGNVDLVTSINGEVHQFFLYTAWGESMHEYHAQAIGFDSPYRFNGKELDAETGDYHYGARSRHDGAQASRRRSGALA